jgi:hypothetical protein
MEKDKMFDESFSLITFEWNGDLPAQAGRTRSPDWRRVSREWVEGLIGEAF